MFRPRDPQGSLFQVSFFFPEEKVLLVAVVTNRYLVQVGLVGDHGIPNSR